MLKSLRLFLLVSVLTVSWPAFADECGDAVVDYNSVLSHLSDALARYSTCIADSKGNDDCVREFRRLQLAQSQFASSVAIYIKACL